MTKQHQPIDRVFEIVEVDPMSREEAEEFFEATFQSANIFCEKEAAGIMAHYSAGFPKIMQLIGDTAYFSDSDNRINGKEAI